MKRTTSQVAALIVVVVAIFILTLVSQGVPWPLRDANAIEFCYGPKGNVIVVLRGRDVKSMLHGTKEQPNRYPRKSESLNIAIVYRKNTTDTLTVFRDAMFGTMEGISRYYQMNADFVNSYETHFDSLLVIKHEATLANIDAKYRTAYLKSLTMVQDIFMKMGAPDRISTYDGVTFYFRFKGDPIVGDPCYGVNTKTGLKRWQPLL